MTKPKYHTSAESFMESQSERKAAAQAEKNMAFARSMANFSANKKKRSTGNPRKKKKGFIAKFFSFFTK